MALMDIIVPLTLLVSLFQSVYSLINCGTTTSFPVTWMDFPPYVFREKDIDPDKYPNVVIGAIHGLAEDMVRQCCGSAAHLVMSLEVNRSTEIEENMSTSALAYPATRRSAHTMLDSQIPEWSFLPVVELAGSYVLLDLDHLENVVMNALIGAWPLAVLVLSAAGVSGFTIWLLDRSSNEMEFPRSFVHGGWEGIWWAIVTATTVGYGDRAPRSIPARVFGLVWMLVGIILMSVFTATLVSAIQAEDKIGTDIKGAKIAVVSGSQEEHYAFLSGAVPQAYNSFNDVLDNLENKTVDAALVDPFYVLYFSDELFRRNIHTADIVRHTGVHGILVNNISAEIRACFAKYIAVKHYRAFEFIVDKVGSLTSMRGKAAHHTSHKLVGSNMIIIYVCCAMFTLMLMLFCMWEFVWFRPRTRREYMKAKSLEMQEGELLMSKEDLHQS